jgi:DNA replication and repair protein RecF
VSIGGIPIRRIGELMGAVNCVFFSPDEMRIIKDGPPLRRRFMDVDISQMSKTYFYLLSRYEKVLSQRNRLLKSGVAGDTLPVWDAQLAEIGGKIVVSRRRFIKKLSDAAAEEHAYLTDGAEQLTVAYEGAEGETPEEVRDNLIRALTRGRERDLRNGFTGDGPHKDDFCTAAGGVDLRSYGSQGQQRTAALSLKLAELRIFAGETGETPVLLLDDVLSELDGARQQRLLMRIKGVQTLLTCADGAAEISGDNLLTVAGGKVIV